MVFGTGMSILESAREVGGALMGVIWNKYLLKMTSKELHRLDHAMLIIVLTRLVSLSYIYMLPSN